jgi:hypothetical protein
MASYGVDVTADTQDQLMGDHPAVTMPIVLVSGENLKRGHVLGVITTSGKYTGYDADVATGEEVAKAILAEDTDASGGDANTIAYVHGGFQTRGLLWDDKANDETTGLTQLFSAGLFCK